MIKDLFGNELNVRDEVVNVLIHKNEAKIRTGIIENISQTPRNTIVYIRNSDTNRLTLKKTSQKDGFICKEIIKYDWKKYVYKNQPVLFPELF